jgi:hypothetical protein
VNRSEGQWTQPDLSFEVQRGVPFNARKTSGSAGIHWTASPKTANHFATSYPIQPWSKPDFKKVREGRWVKGHIFTGSVPLSSVETNNKTLYDVGNTGEFPEEKEVTAKRGAPVQVKARTTLVANDSNNIVRRRTRTYNPPREMRA